MVMLNCFSFVFVCLLFLLGFWLLLCFFFVVFFLFFFLGGWGGGLWGFLVLFFGCLFVFNLF